MRHLHRYREIIAAFSRNGFGYIVKELGLYELIPLPKRFTAKQRKKIDDKTIGERLRSFLQELGPTFVKVGQFASTRPDLVPEHIIRELEKLQDDVPSYPYKDVLTTIEEELGLPVDDVFESLDEKPIGSASIGQVHYGILHSGERVAVKVQRPNIEKDMKTDLEILKQLASLAEGRLDFAARFQVTEIVDEFAKALLQELDYNVERRNAERITKQFTRHTHIYIPKVYPDYSSKKVLTMEYINGMKLKQIDELKQLGYDRKVLAERVAKAILHQIFMEGVFHADPHPGNIAALPGNDIVFMDFGMVGRLTDELKTNLVSLVIAMMRQNTDGVIRAINRMGLIPDDVNMTRLTEDIDDLRDKYYDIALNDISMGDAVNDLFELAHQHKIKIPADLTLLGKSLMTMEGLVENLDPELSIMKLAEPFGRQLLRDRYHPKRVVKSLIGHGLDAKDNLNDIPRNLRKLTDSVKKGKIPVEISVEKADSFLKKLDRISNRLSFSIVLLSFSIIMVGLIIGSALGGQHSMLWNIPAVEIGFIFATIMFIWLLFSIFRSGRF